MVGGIIMFLGIASIPLVYKSAAGFGLYWTLILIMIQMIPIGMGLFLVYTALCFKKSVVSEINNAQPANIPAPGGMANMPKRIEIIVNDNSIALSTEGMSLQEITASLELTKCYIISKYIGCGSTMGVVRRQ